MKDYHNVVYNKNGQPEHSLQFGKMLKVKGGAISKPIIKFSGTVLGKIALGIFVFGLATIIFYQNYKHS